MPVEDTDLDTLLLGHRHVDLKHITNLPSTLFQSLGALDARQLLAQVMLSESLVDITITNDIDAEQTPNIDFTYSDLYWNGPTALVGHTGILQGC